MIRTDGPLDEQRVRLQRALGDAYEIRDAIGSGGFATVFSAFDRQLKREVAVKVLRAELEAPVFRERFRREAEAVAQLRHPHIVPIYSVGEADGLAWIVMPHVRGESLQQRLDREGKLPIDDAIRILRDAASALSAAHRAGILHRDIKPDNIMLDGADGHVLLMDFGIAKALGGPEAGVTATGMIVGTPQYMSPEQATGEKSIDHRSDVYALGVVGFQMIAGTPPFSASSVHMLIMKLVTEPAPVLIELRRDCPRALSDAIGRCLEKEPDARWSSSDEFCRALSAGPAGALAPGIRRISSRISAAMAEPGVPAPIRQFRSALVIAAGALIITGAVDLYLRNFVTLPVASLLAATAIALRYGRLWTDGYDWRQVLSPPTSSPELGDSRSTSGSTGKSTPRSMEMKRLGSFGPRVHRARSDRGTIIAILAQLPRSERERMPDVLTPLDSLLAEATSLAAQLSALESSATAASGVTQTRYSRLHSGKAAVGHATSEQGRAAEIRAKVESHRTESRARMEQEIERCLGRIEALRVAVERIEAEGWTSAEPLLREVL